MPRRPHSALICRWKAEGTGEVEKAESIVRSKTELADLVRTPNSLGVRSDEEWEGEYAACHEEPIHDYGVGLHYPGPTEVQLVISYNGCGYVWNVQDGTAFLPSERLETTLDRLLESPKALYLPVDEMGSADRTESLLGSVGTFTRRSRSGAGERR